MSNSVAWRASAPRSDITLRRSTFEAGEEVSNLSASCLQEVSWNLGHGRHSTLRTGTLRVSLFLPSDHTRIGGRADRLLLWAAVLAAGSRARLLFRRQPLKWAYETFFLMHSSFVSQERQEKI